MKNDVMTVLNSLTTSQVDGAIKHITNIITDACLVVDTDKGKKLVPPKGKDLEDIRKSLFCEAVLKQDASLFHAMLEHGNKLKSIWEVSDAAKTHFKSKEDLLIWLDRQNATHTPITWESVTTGPQSKRKTTAKTA